MDIFDISISNIPVSIFHKLSLTPGDKASRYFQVLYLDYCTKVSTLRKFYLLIFLANLLSKNFLLQFQFNLDLCLTFLMF